MSEHLGCRSFRLEVPACHEAHSLPKAFSKGKLQDSTHWGHMGVIASQLQLNGTCYWIAILSFSFTVWECFLTCGLVLALANRTFPNGKNGLELFKLSTEEKNTPSGNNNLSMCLLPILVI